MAQYPTSVPTFTTKQDGVDYPQASHINGVQDEVTALADGLRNGIQHAVTISTGGLTVSTGGATINGSVTISASLTCSSIVRANNQPRCMVFSSAAVSMSDGSSQAIAFESEDYDVGGMHSTATNPERLTVPTGSSGLWFVGARALTSTGGSGSAIRINLTKNGSTNILTRGTAIVSSVVRTSVEAQGVVVLDAGDYIEAYIGPNGSTMSLPTASERGLCQQMWAVRLF